MPVTLPLPAFRAEPLGDDIALATYLSEIWRGGSCLCTNRASIWGLSDGRWRLRFHQGTPIPG